MLMGRRRQRSVQASAAKASIDEICGRETRIARSSHSSDVGHSLIGA
jgi:hypothetical protein